MKMPYNEYEKAVFNWLMDKHDKNPNFTFSLRQMASKGSESDYFIGTEKSGYFATTFWSIHIGYPGSAGDLINVVFNYHENDLFSYHFKFNQTKSPDDNQNKCALGLIINLKPNLRKVLKIVSESDPRSKIEAFKLSPIESSYSNINSMMIDVMKDVDKLMPIVNKAIQNEKKENESFEANQISIKEFDIYYQKMKKRLEKYGKTILIQKEGLESKDLKFPLNQILFGPPGTGKTYNTIILAAQIIENKKITDYNEAQRIFNKYLRDQIEFITFHQNYSYEDFIQGLRPDVDNGPELTFERKDGVFKRIADRALKNITDSEKPSEAKRSFDIVFNEFISPLSKEEVEEIEVPMKKVSFYVNVVTSKSIEFRKNDGDSKHSLSIATLRKMYDKGENDLILGGLQPYYNPILSVLLKKGKSSVEHVTRKNYVIIIDEINRANISRVFGELITLIECDKRSHGAIPLRCTLPSGDEFIVPSNLYIIGTMNTADKSIALLDIALRRRFEFEPMYPLYEIEGQQIYDSEILAKINKRIKELKGHDFQIGHSYFMGDNKDLVERMNKKVIPLLLEYFMNDEKEVKGILTGAGLSVEPDSWPLKINGLL